ncbi:hypothetical protein FB451DRAFT_555015 [Mycena latifolia]|nr:hypothetical protein FB451DRAFT_555015 [Mycena latifolia]
MNHVTAFWLVSDGDSLQCSDKTILFCLENRSLHINPCWLETLPVGRGRNLVWSIQHGQDYTSIQDAFTFRTSPRKRRKNQEARFAAHAKFKNGKLLRYGLEPFHFTPRHRVQVESVHKKLAQEVQREFGGSGADPPRAPARAWCVDPNMFVPVLLPQPVHPRGYRPLGDRIRSRLEEEGVAVVRAVHGEDDEELLVRLVHPTGDGSGAHGGKGDCNPPPLARHRKLESPRPSSAASPARGSWYTTKSPGWELSASVWNCASTAEMSAVEALHGSAYIAFRTARSSGVLGGRGGAFWRGGGGIRRGDPTVFFGTPAPQRSCIRSTFFLAGNTRLAGEAGGAVSARLLISLANPRGCVQENSSSKCSTGFWRG